MTTLVDEILGQNRELGFAGELEVLTIPAENYEDMENFEGGNPIHKFYQVQSINLTGSSNSPFFKIEAIPLYLNSSEAFIDSLVRYHSPN